VRRKELVAEIRKEAKLGRSEKAVKLLAGQIVQLRAQRDRLLGARTQVGALATHASAMASQVAVTAAVGSAGKALGAMNKTMDQKKLGLTMAEFQRESEKMAMTEEMMGDMLSDAFDSEDAETETDAVVDQVLAEVGVEQTAGILDAPTGQIKAPATPAETVDAEPQTTTTESADKQLADLQAQLNSL